MRILVAILLASSLGGCTSIELLYWAESKKTPGRLEGVLREDRHDRVLYSFALEQGGRQFRAFDVPRDWNGDREIHELYGYEPRRYRWILLGSVDVGQQRPNRLARTVTAILLVPAFAFDVCLFALAALTGSANAPPLGPLRSHPPRPIDMRIRGRLMAPGAG